MKQKNILLIAGAVLAALVGIGRGIGGCTLIATDSTATGITVGIGLIFVALWLIIAAIALLRRPTLRGRLWLIIGVILYWTGGTLNGFLLFGKPQLSGQIINFVLSTIILICIWPRKKDSTAS